MKIYVVTVDENEITVSLNGEAAVAKTVKPTITALANRNFRFECDGIDEEVESYLDIFINGQPLKGSWLSDEEWLAVSLFDAIMNKTFTSGGGSSPGSSYLVSTVELNDAEIKALMTTPIELVAAPGLGKIINVVSVSAVLNITDAYDPLDELSIVYDGIGVISVIETSALIQLGISFYQSIISGGTYIDPSNIAIKLTSNSNPTLGNAANTLKVTVYYVVVDL